MELTETQNELIAKGVRLELEQIRTQATNYMLPNSVLDAFQKNLIELQEITRLLQEYYIVLEKR